MNLRNITLAVIVFSMAAFGQISGPIAGFGTPAGTTLNAGVPDAFQINYLPNPTVNGGGFIDMSNAGALGAAFFGPLLGSKVGYICANVYAFTPDEQEVACCVCPMSPNSVWHLVTATDLAANTATGVVPASLTVKIVTTLPTGETTANAGSTGAVTCDSPALIPYNTAAAATAKLAPGLRAWATKIHQIPAGGGGAAFTAATETAFLPAPLSPGELASIVNRCAGIVGNASGAGICGACRVGAVGGGRK